MRRRKPINYEIETNGEPIVTQLPKPSLDSLVFTLELAIYELIEKEKTDDTDKERT